MGEYVRLILRFEHIFVVKGWSRRSKNVSAPTWHTLGQCLLPWSVMRYFLGVQYAIYINTSYDAVFFRIDTLFTYAMDLWSLYPLPDSRVYDMCRIWEFGGLLAALFPRRIYGRFFNAKGKAVETLDKTLRVRACSTPQRATWSKISGSQTNACLGFASQFLLDREIEAQTWWMGIYICASIQVTCNSIGHRGRHPGWGLHRITSIFPSPSTSLCYF